MKFKSLLTVVLLAVSEMCMAQVDTLSLKRCIALCIENNLSLHQQQENIRIAGIEQSENRHSLLPKINGFANFTYNITPATSLSDGTNISKLLEKDIPYMMGRGLEFQSGAGIQFAMPLYDQTLYTSIQIADKMKEISEASYEKAKEDLIVEISKLYYLAQTTAKQIELIQSNIGRMESLKSITTAFYENDMALHVDVQRVDINLEDLRTAQTNAEAMHEQQLNMLRYMLDFAPETPIVLSALDEDIHFDDSHLLKGLSSDLYELRLLEMETDVLQQQKRMVNQGYIPSLSLAGGTSWTAYTDNFSHYFHTHPTNKWYNHSYIGLQLDVPIFDGLEKRNKSQKIAVQYSKLQTAIEDTKKELQTQYRNSLNDWYNNVRNAERQQDNYRLAENVYLITSDQYKEGVASMGDLLQDRMRMTEAQNGYISALYKYMVSELTLLKLIGQLNLLTE